MNQAKIAIIGLGPRGLNVLERIIAYARAEREISLAVHIFDPNLPGAGVHDVSQPEHLIVNTIACQITQFSDDSLRGAGPVFVGPSFVDWLSESCRNNSHPHNGEVRAPVDVDGYYPRALLGQYLNWVFNYLRAGAPTNVEIIHHRSLVEGIERRGNHRWQLVARGETKPREIDFIFLTTGHSRSLPTPSELDLASQVAEARTINPNLGLVLDPYPVKRMLTSCDARRTVALEGAGLAGFDVISELTIGRGGRFRRLDERCVYAASGDEPAILLITRSGLPLTARARNQKGVQGQYKPKFLTAESVKRLKCRQRHGNVDFKRDVMPSLLLEMSCAYYYAVVKHSEGMSAAMRFCNDFVASRDGGAREALIAGCCAPGDRFSWEALVDPIPADARRDRATFRRWLMEYLKEDLRQAALGNVDSPIKAACDVLRDLRDTLRSLVDFGGLDEMSHRWFMSDFIPVMNRLAVGPPKHRIEELIALIEAGIVRFDFGPRASWSLDASEGKFRVTSQAFEGYAATADVLVRGRIAMPKPAEDRSPLMTRLLADGLVRPFRNGTFKPGGIEVNRDLNVIGRGSRPLSTMWCLGTPAEGCKFYTFVLPRPGVNSTALVDAGRVVGQMMNRIRRSSRASGSLHTAMG
jgi:hypothetical protein